MKLLLDEGMPRSTAALLREVGLEAIHVAEIAMAGAEDADILARAFRADWIIVTLDADFHALLALAAARGPSVIRIRVEGLRAQALVNLLQDVVQRCEQDLKIGAMVSVQEGRIRIRHLPILKADSGT